MAHPASHRVLKAVQTTTETQERQIDTAAVEAVEAQLASQDSCTQDIGLAQNNNTKRGERPKDNKKKSRCSSMTYLPRTRTTALAQQNHKSKGGSTDSKGPTCMCATGPSAQTIWVIPKWTMNSMKITTAGRNPTFTIRPQ